jgi:streptomycin 6-kinase
MMNNFETNIINIYGEKAVSWLINLPKLLARITSQYQLRNLQPLENLSYNYLLSGFQSDNPIILKLSLDTDGLKQEALALSSFADVGAIKIIAESEGMLLLERAKPGLSLKSYFPSLEAETIIIVSNIMKKLHVIKTPKTQKFPHIKDWLTALDREHSDIPNNFLNHARKLRDYLLSTAPEQILLHGDLHHDNVLQHDQGWVVIDPKGVIGERAYEVTTFIRNPMPELLELQNPSRIINERINCFANILELDKERIKNWCVVQTILAWIWALEDNSDTSYYKKFYENNV